MIENLQGIADMVVLGRVFPRPPLCAQSCSASGIVNTWVDRLSVGAAFGRQPMPETNPYKGSLNQPRSRDHSWKIKDLTVNLCWTEHSTTKHLKFIKISSSKADFLIQVIAPEPWDSSRLTLRI